MLRFLVRNAIDKEGMMSRSKKSSLSRYLSGRIVLGIPLGIVSASLFLVSGLETSQAWPGRRFHHHDQDMPHHQTSMFLHRMQIGIIYHFNGRFMVPGVVPWGTRYRMIQTPEFPEGMLEMQTPRTRFWRPIPHREDPLMFIQRQHMQDMERARMMGIIP